MRTLRIIGLVRLFRGSALAVLAVTSLVVWVHLSKNLPAHEHDPHKFSAEREVSVDVVLAGPDGAQQDARSNAVSHVAADAIVATSCELRCGSDAPVVVLGDGADSSVMCACDAGSCPRNGADQSHNNPCCASYLLHCTNKNKIGHLGGEFQQAVSHRPLAANPRPFPPLHHGPELVYVDAVAVYCESPQMRVADVVAVRCVPAAMR